MPEITLHRKQAQAIMSPQRIVIMCSGIQGGKTFSGALWLRKIVSEIPDPDSNFIVCAPTTKIFHQATEPAFLKIFEPLGKYNRTNSVFDLGNNRKIYLRTMHVPEAIEGITNVRGIWADECGMYSSKAWINVEGRSAVKQAQIFGTTTPYALNWLYKDIYKGWRDGDRKDIEFIQFESIENPYFPKEEFERQKSLLDPRVFAMKYCGQFQRMAGLVFMEIDEEANSYEYFIPSTADYYICAGVDWGYTNQFAVAVRAMHREEKRDYQIDEFYKSYTSLSEKIGICKQLKAKWGIETFYCDNESPESINEFNRAGLSAIGAKKYPGSLEDNIARHSTLINSRVHKIFKGRCPHTWDEYETYHYAEDDGKEINSPEKPVDANNHLMTANMYATQCTEHIRRRWEEIATPRLGVSHLDRLLNGEFAKEPQEDWYYA